jgi:glycosyltransferase involved in cell wall biosynthesis
MSDQRIYIVVPAYNESGSIRSVIQALLENYQHVVVVDDGSTDDTAPIIREYPVVILHHLMNRGQGAALQTGIEYALESGAEVIVTFDADGQHDASDIQGLIHPILAGDCDVTLGSRFLGEAHHIPTSRKILLKAGIFFTRVFSGIKVTDVHNGLRAFSRKAARSINIRMERMGHATEILEQLSRAGFIFLEVPVNVYYSDYSLKKGQSSWNFVRVAAEILLDKAGVR